ncbi:MAG: hypothetical protein JWO35_913 [Candidatus Saccharibacteria bacterium]|nr:hypothetical protein [Candidatus Saccharibacteria bacterium]
MLQNSHEQTSTSAAEINERNDKIVARGTDRAERQAAKDAFIYRARLNNPNGTHFITAEDEQRFLEEADKYVDESFDDAENDGYDGIDVAAVKAESEARKAANGPTETEKSRAAASEFQKGFKEKSKVDMKKQDNTWFFASKPDVAAYPSRDTGVRYVRYAQFVTHDPPRQRSRIRGFMDRAKEKLTGSRERKSRRRVIAGVAAAVAIAATGLTLKDTESNNPATAQQGTEEIAKPPLRAAALGSQVVKSAEGIGKIPVSEVKTGQIEEVTIKSGSGNTIYNEATKNLQRHGNPTPTLRQKIAEMHRIMELNHITEDEATTLAGAGDVKLKI